MPLKLLKRTSKQYNVVSKSTFVISVELLDNVIMECTMDADSTGADCLLNISQRLGLHQPDFFGLRYISRGVPPRQRWVDLDRPLKKQLEKYAEDFNLSLGVIFYVSDVNLLKDEMTRYHYFLQLKSDVIEGKLNCSIDQAISLAAYSLQAEFGDYAQDRHTIDYLRDFAILPKELTSECKYPDLNLDALYEAVTKNYSSLVGFPPPLAEIYYIMVTQQLDGYGESAFPAKDDSGNDILFCVSVKGLVIRRRDWSHIAAFRFHDIKSLMGHKKLLVVQGNQSQRSIKFHFADPEVVKYVKKICVLQTAFHKENLKREVSNGSNDCHIHNNNLSVVSGSSTSTNDQMDGYGQSRSPSVVNSRTTPDLTQSSPNAIYENQLAIQGNNNSVAAINYGGQLNGASNIRIPAGYTLQDNYSQQLEQKHNKLFGISNSMMNLKLQPFVEGFSREIRPADYGQRFQFSRSASPMNRRYGESSNSPANWNQAFNINGANPVANFPSGSGHTVDLHSLLPTYRSAPDYHTAVQQKYGPGFNTNNLPHIVNAKTSSTIATDRQYYYNQQEEEEEDDEPIYENEIVSQIHSIETRDKPAKDVDTNNAIAKQEQSRPQQAEPEPLQGQARPVCTFVLDDPTKSYLYKPPPPYPGNRAGPTISETIVGSKHAGTGHQKLKPALSDHSDILRQIETQLKHSQSVSFSTSGINAQTTAYLNRPVEVNLNKSSHETISQDNTVNAADATYQNINVSRAVSPANSAFANAVSEPNSTLLAIQQQNASSFVSTREKAYHQRKSDAQKINSKSKISVLDFHSTTVDSNILKEFQAISRAKPSPNFSTAMKKENAKRNRCPNILPYEDNLIQLSPTRQNPDGYINASAVSAMISGREWKYIVGQIPLAGNVPTIWQLVWEKDVKIIAALERDSTALFYPLDASTSSSSSALNTMYFGDFQVVDSKSDKATATSIAREVTLIYLPKKQQRKVWVLPYEDEWKEDVPVHAEHFLCFLEEVNSIQRKVSDSSKPLVVVCGTGSGRSGVLVLCDALIHSADAGYKIRCDTLLGDLRTQRMLLVTSPAQYAFVLHTLEKYLAQSRLI